MRLVRPCLVIILSAALAGACGTESGGDDDVGDDDVATHSVHGTVRDFVTGDAVATSATISIDGLSPAPTVSVTGAKFAIEGVPPFSVFHILAGSPPAYRSTYNVATTVESSDLTGVDIYVIAEAYLGELAVAFGVTPSPGTTVLLARLVDETGAPRAGVPGTAFELPTTIAGPFFLDANRQPDAALSESSTSGYVILFDIQPGLVTIDAVAGSGYGMAMPDSPAAATAATLAEIVVTDGGLPELPTNVSFSADVSPIFLARGCVLCHDGSGIGKDLGGLHLNGAPEKMYKELVEEISPNHRTLRVNVLDPEASLMLTMPSREDPPDVHPNITFASPDDPDYLTILVWIREGALQN